MKIRYLGAELFHVDRRTDRHDSRFSRFRELALKREGVVQRLRPSTVLGYVIIQNLLFKLLPPELFFLNFSTPCI